MTECNGAITRLNGDLYDEPVDPPIKISELIPHQEYNLPDLQLKLDHEIDPDANVILSSGQSTFKLPPDGIKHSITIYDYLLIITHEKLNPEHACVQSLSNTNG